MLVSKIVEVCSPLWQEFVSIVAGIFSDDVE